MKTAFEAVIVERREMPLGHVELILESPRLAQAVPGQFCHVLTPGMLRRPISFSRLQPEQGLVGILLQVVGSGTEWLFQRAPGQRLDVMGPLGRGFSPPAPDRPWLLVGGGVGIPPLYAAVQAWRSRVAQPARVVLGARTRDAVIMAEDFQGEALEVVITTDDGSWGQSGTVMGPARAWLEAHPDSTVTGCGPTSMLAALYRLTQSCSGPVQLAMEQRMGCGIGACLACVVPAAPTGPAGPQWRRVCTDGPVFWREELRF